MSTPLNEAVDRMIAAARAEGEMGTQALMFAAAYATLALNDDQAAAAFAQARSELRKKRAHLRPLPESR